LLPRGGGAADNFGVRAVIVVIALMATAAAAPMRPLVSAEGYRVRRPERAFGAAHVVAHVKRAIGEVRALYPHVHAVAIGDLSFERGGPISDHASHRTGLDVDIGFYFTRVPDGYPERFAAADERLDLEATWALIVAFAQTADRDDGVEVIFLDRAVQARLAAWARRRGTPDEQIAFVLGGLVKHWPNHVDHMHVRFKRRP